MPVRRKTRLAYPLILAATVSVLATGCAAASSGSAGSSSGGQGSGGSGGNDKAVTKSKTVKKVAGVGDPVKDGKFKFTVTKVRKGVKSVGDSMFGQKAQGQFVLVSVTVENIGTKAQTFSSSGQEMYDAQKRKFDADDSAGIYLKDANSLYTPINPGNVVKGTLIFDIPKTAKPTKLELHDSMFSGGVDVAL